MSRPLLEIEGFRELQQKIKLLSDDKDKRKEVLLILRQVAKPTLAAAKSYAPVSKRPHISRGKKLDTGNLKKSLGLITGKNENPTIYVGPRAKGSNDGWYGAMVEKGHNVYNKGYKRKHSGGGVNDHAAVKRTRPNPYMQNAYSSTNGGVTGDAERKVALFIQRRIDKLSTNV